MIQIFTDGSSRGNPGRGGYGIVMMSGVHRKEMAQGYRKTTNNRMELLAVIVALETIKVENATVLITSDSKYVIDSVEKKWILGWIKKNWKDVKNPDLWQRFLKVYKMHSVKFKWVKGHNNHPENERCDMLATAAADSGNLLIDAYYEQNIT
ncbi:MAG: Ribonuclease [Bacteroidota bacterium]|jgi:ribonuclease HI